MKVFFISLLFFVSLSARPQSNVWVKLVVDDKRQNPVPAVLASLYREGLLQDSARTDNNGSVFLVIQSVRVEETGDQPLTFSLGQNYPNPFNPGTIIKFSTPESGWFIIYNLLGQEIARKSIPGPGDYTARWGGVTAAGKQVGEGIYFYTVETAHQRKTRKMTLMGSGRSVPLGISGTSRRPPAGEKILEDTFLLRLERLNMTTQEINFQVSGNTILHAIVNVGPTILDTIPTQVLNVGDTMSVNLDDYVYNDEAGLFLPRDTANFDVDGNIISYNAVQPETLSTWIDVVDDTDNALRDSLFFKVLVPYIATPLAFDLPGLIEINEDSDIDTLVADLNDYVSPNQEATITLISQSNPELANLILNDYTLLVDSLKADDYGESMFALSASNNDTTVVDSALLRVLGVNDAPVFNGTVPNYTVSQDSLLLIPASTFFTDIDNDTLDYIIQNLSNATQEDNEGIITVTPSEGWNGTIAGLVLQASDGEYTAESGLFDITVNQMMTNIHFMFKAMYGDTTLTSGTSTLTYRKMFADSSGYEWGADSVATSENGEIDLTLEQGLYDINGLHSAAIDSAITNGRYVFLARPGQIGVAEQRARYDQQSQILLNTENDTIIIYKLMNDFPLFYAREYTVKKNDSYIGTRRFGNNDFNAPAWWNTNYMTPDSTRRAWTNELLAELQTIPHMENFAMQYLESTETPNQPFLGIAVGSSFPSPGTNLTYFDNESNEIIFCEASYPPWPTKYTFRIEVLQAISDMDDFSGADPAILTGSADGNVINDRGRRVFSLLYLADPKTKL